HRGDAERAVAPRRTEGPVPDRFAGAQVDRAKAAVGRFLAEQAGERQTPAGVDVDRIGRAGLRVPGTLGASTHVAAAGIAARGPAPGIGLGARYEAIVVGHVVVVGDYHAAHRIDRDPAPIRSAVIARILDPAP